MNNSTEQTSSGCDAIREQLALLLYGELSFDEEEQVETHLDSCKACGEVLQSERELLLAIDQVAVEPSPALLLRCRENLAARLESERLAIQSVARAASHDHAHQSANQTMVEYGQAAVAMKREPNVPGFWAQLGEMLTLNTPDGFPALSWARPVGAFALVAMGFFGARVAPNILPGLDGGMGGGFTSAGLMDAGVSQVRSVESSADGVVRIVVDETRQREVTGQLDDDLIRGLLLAASTDSSNLVRQETVSLLSTRPQADDVRDALLYVLHNDENSGVRLRALEGLKSFSQDGDVQDALAEVLLMDENPGMRQQAIDVLLTGLENASEQNLDGAMIGKLQQVMVREKENTYVRQQCQRVLEQVNASSEIF